MIEPRVTSPRPWPHIYLLDRRVEVIEPALTALLPSTSGDPRRNHRPLLSTVLTHKIAQKLVLLRQPRTYGEGEGEGGGEGEGEGEGEREV